MAMIGKQVLFSVNEAVRSGIYYQILSNFPKTGLQYAFAYGSGVFKQDGHKDMSKNMLDFIFVVDDPEKWHRENLKVNNKHYSFLKHFGPHYLSMIQERFGANCYFNTLVPCAGRLIKYGVISTEHLIDDLLDWESLYIGGRLHKPVLTLVQGDNPDLIPSLVTNLQSAVHTALLLLSDTFTEDQLFCTITGLSYSGDFRMVVGEDKNKVKNIVLPNMEKFHELYEPILSADEHLHWNKSSRMLEQSLSPRSRHHHLNLLPKSVMVGLVNQRNIDGRNRDVEEVLRSYAHDPECDEVIGKCVSGIVRQSSLSQSTKGVLTAGLVKTLRYSWSKLEKMWKGKK